MRFLFLLTLLCASFAHATVITPPAVGPDNVTLESSGGKLRIKNGGVTASKKAAPNYQLSGSSGGFNTTSGSAVQITNLSVTITTSAVRPVLIAVIPDGSGVTCNINSTASSGTFQSVNIYLKRGSTEIGRWGPGSDIPTSGSFAARFPCSSIFMIDFPASAGTYTYTLHGSRNGDGSSSLWFLYAKLLAYEL